MFYRSLHMTPTYYLRFWYLCFVDNYFLSSHLFPFLEPSRVEDLGWCEYEKEKQNVTTYKQILKYMVSWLRLTCACYIKICIYYIRFTFSIWALILYVYRLSLEKTKDLKIDQSGTCSHYSFTRCMGEVNMFRWNKPSAFRQKKNQKQN